MALRCLFVSKCTTVRWQPCCSADLKAVRHGVPRPHARVAMCCIARVWRVWLEAGESRRVGRRVSLVARLQTLGLSPQNSGPLLVRQRSRRRVLPHYLSVALGLNEPCDDLMMNVFM